MTSLSLWRPPKLWQTANFERNSNSVILLAYHLDVELLLVREHEVRQRAVGHLLADFSTFLGPHGHMIGLKFLTMQNLGGLHTQIVPQHLVHGGFAHTGCGDQGSAASARVLSQLFPRVFEELRGANTLFSVKGVSGLLELLHDLPHRWAVYIQPYYNFNIIFSTFVKLNHCISVCSHCKTNFENFGTSSLKVETVSFQMVIILRKLTTLKGFYRKPKIGCLNSWTPCILPQFILNSNIFYNVCIWNVITKIFITCLVFASLRGCLPVDRQKCTIFNKGTVWCIWIRYNMYI